MSDPIYNIANDATLKRNLLQGEGRIMYDMGFGVVDLGEVLPSVIPEITNIIRDAVNAQCQEKNK